MAQRPVGRRRATEEGGSEVTPADVAGPAPAEADRDRHRQPDAAGPAAPAPDAVSDRPSDTHTALPPKVESWRKRSATGAILTGFALGLQQVFEPERKEPSIVQETSGEPPRDLPVEAELEGVVGRRSVVRIRPWLLDEEAVDAGQGVDPELGVAAEEGPHAVPGDEAAQGVDADEDHDAAAWPLTTGVTESPITGVTSHSPRTRARRARQARRLARRRR